MMKFILIFILLVGSLSAEYMKVTLKNNTFDIYNDCSAPNRLYSNDYKCDRNYIIKLESKYNVFENYSQYRSNGAKIVTDLYTIYPRIYNPNKSEFSLYLSEDDLEKLFRSHKIKIIFDLDLFSEKLLRRELKSINSFAYDISILEPTVILNLSNQSINVLKDNCKRGHDVCMKKLDTLNSPTNRLKRFFNF